MNALNQQISETLNKRRRDLTEALVEREFAAHPDLEQRYGKTGREKSLQDAGYHLSFLAQAIGMDKQLMFDDYVAWVKVLLVQRQVPVSDLYFHLSCMADVLKKNLPAESGEVAARFIRRAMESMAAMPEDQPTFLQQGEPLTPLAQRYLDSLLRGERHLASRLILEAVASGTSIKDIYLRVFEPTQHEIGRLWQINRLSVAQEHYCTAATQWIMSKLYLEEFAFQRKTTTLVATCVAEDLHEIGLRMVADLFEMDGWQTFYLGANTPHASVIKTVIDQHADVLGISATMAYHLDGVRELIRAVRHHPSCAGVKILVGGYPFSRDPELWRQIGADGSASNAGEALELANQIIAERDAPVPIPAAEGMVILCDSNGAILRILRDDLHLSMRVPTGSSLTNLIDPPSRELVRFLEEVQAGQTVHDWKIDVPLEEESRPLYFSGARIDHEFLVVAASSRYGMTHLGGDLMGIDREQGNALRATFEQIGLQSQGPPKSDDELFDDLSRLNNELANLHREMAKKNAELVEQTDRLRHLALELTSVEQRERKRLAALLHDDLQQLLTAAIMELSRVVPRERDEASNKSLKHAAQRVTEALSAARELTLQLRPPILYEGGFIKALHWLSLWMREHHHLHIAVNANEIQRSLSDDVKAMLFECIREILLNAAKYADVDQAAITVREEPKCLRITVCDSGRGFDVEALQSPRQRGGFGLFSIRERLTALGGRLTIESAPGKGTRVEFTLPLSDQIAGEKIRENLLTPLIPTEPEDQKRNAVTADSRLRVLVVDDHPIIRSGIANILADDPRLGTCDEASDGLAAIEAMERAPSDVVLMDLNMPRMNGIEATREIHRRWPNTQIIGLSVHDDKTTISSMLEAGAAEFLTKSEAPNHIIETIVRVTQRVPRPPLEVKKGP